MRLEKTRGNKQTVRQKPGLVNRSLPVLTFVFHVPRLCFIIKQMRKVGIKVDIHLCSAVWLSGVRELDAASWDCASALLAASTLLAQTGPGHQLKHWLVAIHAFKLLAVLWLGLKCLATLPGNAWSCSRHCKGQRALPISRIGKVILNFKEKDYLMVWMGAMQASWL